MKTLQRTLYCTAVTLCVAVSGWGQSGQSVLPGASEPVITLQQAIQLAQNSEPGYAAALADKQVAAADRTIARSALLPKVTYENQMIYTQPTRFTQGVFPSANATPIRFIANNSVHEYVSQGVVDETIGLGLVADYRKATAAAMLANAKLEIARRGLVVTVVRRYYDVLASSRKLEVAKHAADEANQFLELTNKLEQGREVAHADVVKARIGQQQRVRELADTAAQNETARLELGVLLFPDPGSRYELNANLNSSGTLPSQAAFEADAAKQNPELRAAVATLRAAQQDLSAARAGFLPDLTLAYAYGIDAPQFAVNNPLGYQNLGYAITGTLNIPVWDWFATPARIKQGKSRRTQAQIELNAAQRQLIADIRELYTEARTAEAALSSLDASQTDASESLRLTELRYRAGEATVLEVVDAQSTLVTTQYAQVDGAVRYALALANLQTMTGQLPK